MKVIVIAHTETEGLRHRREKRELAPVFGALGSRVSRSSPDDPKSPSGLLPVGFTPSFRFMWHWIRLRVVRYYYG